MRIVFVRNAHAEDAEPRPLTEEGRGAARRIAGLLAWDGVVPALVVTTRAVRTHQTADELLGVLGTGCPRVEREELPVDEAGWDALVRELRGRVDGDVLIVGHHAAQLFCWRAFGQHAFSRPSRDDRATACLIEPDGDGWRMTGRFAAPD